MGSVRFLLPACQRGWVQQSSFELRVLASLPSVGNTLLEMIQSFGDRANSVAVGICSGYFFSPDEAQ